MTLENLSKRDKIWFHFVLNLRRDTTPDQVRFYKTRKGARVGDLFMSLVHTAELCGTNPFDYLTELQRHAADLQQNPQEWMPWNYRQTLVGTGATGLAA